MSSAALAAAPVVCFSLSVLRVLTDDFPEELARNPFYLLSESLLRNGDDHWPSRGKVPQLRVLVGQYEILESI